MTRPQWLIVFILTCFLVFVAICTAHEERVSEFDVVHLRLRQRASWIIYASKIPIWTIKDETLEIDVGTRLREVGDAPPIREEDAKWVTLDFYYSSSGFIQQESHRYVRGLAHANAGQTNEQRDKNPWIRWARRDPDGWREFWRRIWECENSRNSAGYVVEVARKHLDKNDDATFATVSTAIHKAGGRGFQPH